MSAHNGRFCGRGHTMAAGMQSARIRRYAWLSSLLAELFNSATLLVAALADVGLGAVLCVVADAEPHRGVHLMRLGVAGGDPADFGGLAAGRGLAAGGAGGQDDGEFLAYLAVAGVEDHVPGVGVDPGQAGDLAFDAGFFPGFADGGLGE
jgi:hypothetical protein